MAACGVGLPDIFGETVPSSGGVRTGCSSSRTPSATARTSSNRSSSVKRRMPIWPRRRSPFASRSMLPEAPSQSVSPPLARMRSASATPLGPAFTTVPSELPSRPSRSNANRFSENPILQDGPGDRSDARERRTGSELFGTAGGAGFRLLPPFEQ